MTASKLLIPIGHVEAGLRSFDRTMPEEINRIVADQLSELLFIHSPEARDNLIDEGVFEGRIHDVGNTMIDSLVAMRPRIEATDAPAAHGLERGGYLVVTLHRPALVDGPLLAEAMARLADVSEELPVVFPVHPRTRNAMDAMGIAPTSKRLTLLDPLGYFEFLSLVEGSAGVLTDSGGIQEETTYLGLPCFTLRTNTERPITVEMGTNVLLGLAPERISEVPALLAEAREQGGQGPVQVGRQRVASNRRRPGAAPARRARDRRLSHVRCLAPDVATGPAWLGSDRRRPAGAGHVRCLAPACSSSLQQVDSPAARRGRSYGASCSGGTGGGSSPVLIRARAASIEAGVVEARRELVGAETRAAAPPWRRRRRCTAPACRGPGTRRPSRRLRSRRLRRGTA